MEKILKIIFAFNEAKECMKRTRFIVDMIEPGDADSVAEIQAKHERLAEFVEKYHPMINAIEKAAQPYIELIEMKPTDLKS